MAWPAVTLAAKFLSLKFIKGAVVGLIRYIRKITSAKAVDHRGRPLEGTAKIRHVLRRESTNKENLIFLLMMLGNFFFGLQELCLWLWGLVAKRLFNQFRLGMPAALQDPEELCQHLKDQPWRAVWPALGRWLAVASLVYWPKPDGDTLSLAKTKDPRWIEVRFHHHVYLVRADKERDVTFAGLRITADDLGHVTVSAEDRSETIHSIPLESE